MATEETVKIWADLVALALLQGMALLASCLEKVCTLLGITCDELLVCRMRVDGHGIGGADEASGHERIAQHIRVLQRSTDAHRDLEDRRRVCAT